MRVAGVGRPVVHIHSASTAAAVNDNAVVQAARVSVDAKPLDSAGLGPEDGDAEKTWDEQCQERHGDDSQKDQESQPLGLVSFQLQTGAAVNPRKNVLTNLRKKKRQQKQTPTTYPRYKKKGVKRRRKQTKKDLNQSKNL